ncbi:hypothetical protein GGS23DRAFT_569066 [Durotheca rogersii]|uniref:uncharacterized protein n=1 Tax=Durotheca rogersii TaxID=419775 RepID=UPI00221F3F71|nr:uncharacterized protein GGS23DRAFT_569066 [Durotheca rogersii]KAI5863280.1 hypothetical protein GGS23DRAFT_569066 [Durotheca rogersii]
MCCEAADRLKRRGIDLKYVCARKMRRNASETRRSTHCITHTMYAEPPPSQASFFLFVFFSVGANITNRYPTVATSMPVAETCSSRWVGTVLLATVTVRFEYRCSKTLNREWGRGRDGMDVYDSATRDRVLEPVPAPMRSSHPQYRPPACDQ